jgi:hypothetical protein
MAAAASESFSGRFETDVTSNYIRASRSISMRSTFSLLDVERRGSAATPGHNRPHAAKTMTAPFRQVLLGRSLAFLV